jgi:hypothetical protein
MPTVSDVIDAAIREAMTARTLVSKIKPKQVRGVDAIASLKSTALTWFNTHRPVITSANVDIDCTVVDGPYTTVLNSTAKYAARKTYLDALLEAKNALVALRASALTAPALPEPENTDDIAPDFTPLAANEEMRTILTRRWHECCKCVNAEAHLAAIVMMGGLLEALFVARANKMPVKTPLVNAISAPKDKTTGKTVNYHEWMLDSYIKVGHELNWITHSAKNVADILKEYRNYVHPEKEMRHGVTLGFNDSQMFWMVTKSLVRQLLTSASST